MSNWKEIKNASSIFKKNLIVLQCSSISCSLNNVGVNIFEEIKKKLNVILAIWSYNRFSASFLAASLGAKVIEKHFTLSKTLR